jgi:single-stranded DNA-binding protein
MMNENMTILIGRLVRKPTFTSSDSKDCISRTAINVRKGDNKNIIPVIAFGRNAEILHELGDRGSDIYAKCRIEMRSRVIDEKTTITYPSLVIDQFSLMSRQQGSDSPESDIPQYQDQEQDTGINTLEG